MRSPEALFASAHLMICRIDGRVQSILVGGHDVTAVLKRDDYWYCQFFEYVLSLRCRSVD